MKSIVMLGVLCIMLSPVGTYAGDQNVNVNININQSQGYSGGSCVAQEPGGYRVVYSHVHEFQGGPIDVLLPGVDGGFLRLELRDYGSVLYGGLLHPSSSAGTRRMVNADQINRDRPALPCMIGEWTYSAVDRDGSLLGVMVAMITPRLRENLTMYSAMQMNPVLRITIWHKE